MKKFLIFTIAVFFLGCTQIDMLLSNCEKETNIDDTNKCYEDMAIELNDASICDNVKDDCGYPYGCPNTLSCYYNVGLVGKEISACDKTQNPEYRYNCYHGVGIGTQDISICNKIPNNYESSKTKCLNGITPNK